MDSISSSEIEKREQHIKLHFQKEEETKTQLLKLEDEFREHHTLTLNEMQTQKELIDRLWVLSQRYVILVSTGPCCKHPEIYTTPAEDVILREYNEKLKLLRASNCTILKSLHKIRQSLLVFEKLYSELDMTMESPFLLGDTYHKPISFFMELLNDLFKYFHALVLKFDCRAHQLDPADFLTLDEYKHILEPSEDFEEYLQKGLIYCKCLRPAPACEKK